MFKIMNQEMYMKKAIIYHQKMNSDCKWKALVNESQGRLALM